MSAEAFNAKKEQADKQELINLIPVLLVGVLVTLLLAIYVFVPRHLEVAVNQYGKEVIVVDGRFTITERSRVFQAGDVVEFHCRTWSTAERQQNGQRTDSLLVVMSDGTFWLLDQDLVRENFVDIFGLRLPA